MKTLAISAAALMFGLVPLAHAQDGARLNDPAQLQREHNRAVAAHDWANDPYNSRSSDDLNRQQLDAAQAAGGPYPLSSQPMPAAQPMASTGADYSSDQTYNTAGYSDDSNTTVVVAGPTHDVTEASPPPDTNPQSTGTPSSDTPYIDHGQAVPPDGDSTGMIQPKAQ